MSRKKYFPNNGLCRNLSYCQIFPKVVNLQSDAVRTLPVANHSRFMRFNRTTQSNLFKLYLNFIQTYLNFDSMLSPVARPDVTTLYISQDESCRWRMVPTISQLYAMSILCAFHNSLAITLYVHLLLHTLYTVGEDFLIAKIHF